MRRWSRRRENNKILEEDKNKNKKLKRENNTIVEEENKNDKKEGVSKTLCAV